jgi:hypothetical protein
MKGHTAGVFAKHFLADMSGIASFKDMYKELKEGQGLKGIESSFMGILNFASVFMPVDMLGEKIAQRFMEPLGGGLARKGIFHQMSDQMISNNWFGARIFGTKIPRIGSLGIEKQADRDLFYKLIVKREAADIDKSSDYINAIVNQRLKRIAENPGTDLKPISFDDAARAYNAKIAEYEAKSAHFYYMGAAKAEGIQVIWTGIAAKDQTKTQDAASAEASSTTSAPTTTSSTSPSSSDAAMVNADAASAKNPAISNTMQTTQQGVSLKGTVGIGSRLS